MSLCELAARPAFPPYGPDKFHPRAAPNDGPATALHGAGPPCYLAVFVHGAQMFV